MTAQATVLEVEYEDGDVVTYHFHTYRIQGSRKDIGMWTMEEKGKTPAQQLEEFLDSIGRD